MSGPYGGGGIPYAKMRGYGGGGSQIVRAFGFTFDTPNILTGAPLYTPSVGDILLDGWLEIDIAWDGTTPLADFGTFVGTNLGLMTAADDNSSGADMTLADRDGIAYTGDAAGGGLLISQGQRNSLANASFQGSGTAGSRGSAKFTADNPIRVCVTQDGTNTGADPGSTQGAAILYLVTATPI